MGNQLQSPQISPDRVHMDFGARLAEVADKVTVALDQFIPPAAGPEADLMRAMRHAALADGKRIRPFFVLETGALFDAPQKSLLRVATALECIHCYSLIHDDLPCMDDDDLRRGQPTVHKLYDEATAVLAGDALLTLAFKILANNDTHEDANIRMRLIERMADAAGAQGMVGGQMIDMLEEATPRNLNTITRMQRMKTGALIGYATEAGGMIGGANEAQRQSLAGFSNDLGLAYQIADDLLDVEGSPETVGKQTGKDLSAGKANFVTVLGIDGARERVQLLAAQAKEHLTIFRNKAHILLQSVDFVLDRTR